MDVVRQGLEQKIGPASIRPGPHLCLVTAVHAIRIGEKQAAARSCPSSIYTAAVHEEEAVPILSSCS